MRYIDSGSRDPSNTVARWLESILSEQPITAFRMQTGYVGSQPFGLLESALSELRKSDGPTVLLIGSNGGQTSRDCVEDLLQIVGTPRENLNLGVVAFSDGLFHPKVHHVERADGSSAAYVGSANFTYGGTTGKNIEAGVALDTRDGDDLATLDSIARAIDAWFDEPREGLFTVRRPSDVDALAESGVLTQEASPTRPSQRLGSERESSVLRALAGLIRLPAIRSSVSTPSVQPVSTLPSVTRPVPRTFVESWSKKLPSSDAQRKKDGNQSGVVALTQADRRGQIDQTTYFRTTLFGPAVWHAGPTRTGHTMDIAYVEMHTTVLGEYLGVKSFEITHDNFREAQQHNYTAKLSLAPVRKQFSDHDVTGRTLTVGRDAAGAFWFDLS